MNMPLADYGRICWLAFCCNYVEMLLSKFEHVREQEKVPEPRQTVKDIYGKFDSNYTSQDSL